LAATKAELEKLKADHEKFKADSIAAKTTYD